MCRSIESVDNGESITIKAEFHFEIFYKETKPTIAQMMLVYNAVCTERCLVSLLGTTSAGRSVQLSEAL